MSSGSTDSAPEKAPDESSKLKTFLSILRKYALLPRASLLILSSVMLIGVVAE